MQKQMSIHYQYHGILFLVCYCSSSMHMLSILCSAADTVSSVNWFTVFKVLMLNATMLMFLYLSNFGLSLSSVADFSNIGARVLTSAECTPCLPTQRAMQFGHTVWIRVMVTN